MLTIQVTAVSNEEEVKESPLLIHDVNDMLRAFRYVCGYLPGLLEHMKNEVPTRLTIDICRVLKVLPATKGQPS